jgi:hypothetical protein
LAGVLIGLGVVVLLVAAGLGLASLSGEDDPPIAAVAGTTTETFPDGCVTDDPAATAPTITIGAAQWANGTRGASAGVSPGGEMSFDPEPEVEAQLDAIAATGARWIRIDLSWQTIEATRGLYDWCRFDRTILGARARGLDVIALPAYAPAWASAVDSLHAPPEDPRDYAAFVAAAVHRYSPAGVHTWEIWNEPNTATFWAPAPDATAYTALLRAAAATIRAADPDATILSGGLAPAPDDDGRSRIAIGTFIELMYDNGAADSFDALAIHPYSIPARPLANEEWNPFVHLPDYHEQMVARSDGAKQIWLTEFGAPTGLAASAVHEDVQGEWADEAYRAAAGWPWAGPLLWFSMRDLGSDAFDATLSWGLLRQDFSPKPGYQAFRQLMAEVAAP